MRLIVSVPADKVAEVDNLLSKWRGHSARGCRAEFVRLAITEKLARDQTALPTLAADRSPFGT